MLRNGSSPVHPDTTMEEQDLIIFIFFLTFLLPTHQSRDVAVLRASCLVQVCCQGLNYPFSFTPEQCQRQSGHRLRCLRVTNKEMKALKCRKHTFGCRCGYQTYLSITAEEL